MLIDDVEEYKKETPDGIRTETGACRYCGQIRQVQTIFDWDDNKINEAATELCNCDEAAKESDRKQRKERAIKSIERQFGEVSTTIVDQEVRDTMETIVDLICNDRMQSATLDIGKGLKAKISITGKGVIKVERTKTVKTVEEA